MLEKLLILKKIIKFQLMICAMSSEFCENSLLYVLVNNNKF